jgi:hypothetical protein
MEDLSTWITILILSMGLIVGWRIYRRFHPAEGKWSWKQFWVFCVFIGAITAFKFNAEHWFPNLDEREINAIGVVLMFIFGPLVWKIR